MGKLVRKAAVQEEEKNSAETSSPQIVATGKNGSKLVRTGENTVAATFGTGVPSSGLGSTTGTGEGAARNALADALTDRRQSLLNGQTGEGETLGSALLRGTGVSSSGLESTTGTTTGTTAGTDIQALKDGYLAARKAEDDAWDAYNRYNNTTHFSEVDYDYLDGLNQTIIQTTQAREAAEEALRTADPVTYNTAYSEAKYANATGFEATGVGKGIMSIGKTIAAAPGVMAQTMGQQREEELASREDADVLAAREREAAAKRAVEGYMSLHTGSLDLPEQAAELERLSAELAQAAQAREEAEAVHTAPLDMSTDAMRSYSEAIYLKNAAVENAGPVGQFLGSTALSIGQNAALLPMNALVPGSSLVAMGAISAADKMYELGTQGVGAKEALERGVLSGVIEGATEKLPLDTLSELVRNGGTGVIRSLLKQGGVEATEEGIAYAANWVADKAAKDPNAVWDWGEFAQSMAAGGLSGLFFGLGGLLVGGTNAQSGGGQDVDTETAENPAGRAGMETLEPDVTVGTTAENAAPGGVEGQNNTASTGEAGNKGETVSIIQGLRNNIPSLATAQSVFTVSSQTVQAADGRTMAEKAKSLFEKIKGTVTRQGFGDVEINTRAVKDDLSHGIGAAKAAVIPAIPSVIQNGTQIDFQQNWKGRPYDGYVFAAPVTMDGDTVYVAAVVKQTSKNRFYLHEVVDSNGNIIKIDSEERANPTSLAANGGAGTQSSLSSDPTVAQTAQGVKGQYTQAESAARQVYDTARAREAAAGTLGENGEKAFQAVYDGSMDAAEFYAGFAVYYQAGVSGVEQSQVQTPYAARLTEAQKYAAYVSGQNDAALAKSGAAEYTDGRKGATANGAEEVYLRNGGQWSDGADTGGPVRAVEEGAGQAESGTGRSRSADSGAAALTYGEKVSTASLGISRGSAAADIRIVTGGETAATRNAKALAKERGLRLVLFAGNNLTIRQKDGSVASVRGYISGDRVFVRADHPEFTADQLMRHEAGHDRIAKGEIDPDRVRERIARTFGEGKAGALCQLYANAYDGSGLTAGEIWEEIICDSLGDMNIFSGTLDESLAQELLEETRGAAHAEAESGRTRGPPSAGGTNTDGKASREYWRPNLSKAEWSLLNYKMDSAGTELDEATCWVYATEKGVSVFCVYGIGNGTDNTPLYASGGRTAEADAAKFNRYLEGYDNGTDGGREVLNRWVKNMRSAKRNVGGNLYDPANGRTDVGDVRASGRAQRRTGGGASERGKSNRGIGEVKPKFSMETAAEEEASYSRELESLNDLREQNEALQEKVDYWKGQTKRTTAENRTVRKGDVESLAKRLVKEYDSTLKTNEIYADLQALGDYLVRGGDGESELTWREVKDRAVSIARDITESAEVLVEDGEAELYREIRNRLRRQRIAFHDQVDIADYNDFRKRHMGKFILAKDGLPIETLWAELNDAYGENYFPGDIVHSADQLMHLAELLDGMAPIYENPFSHYMAEATEYVANDIIDSLISENIRQTPPTFADRQAMKLGKEKAKGAERLASLREQKNERIAEIRRQGLERTKKALRKVRADRDTKVKELKEHNREKEAARRERQSAAELRRKITRHAGELSQKLRRPTDKQHIPEALRGPVAAMLESINLESQYTVDAQTGKRSKEGDGLPTKRTQAFRELKEQYARIAAEGGGDMVIDPALLGSDADGIQGSFDAVIAMKDTRLADMGTEQLTTVWQVVKAVENSVSTAGKLLSSAKFTATVEWAGALRQDTASRRARSASARNEMLLDLETPYTFFSHYGEAGKAAYRLLSDAQGRQQLMADQVAEQVGKLTDPKTVKKLEKETRTFTTQRGGELTLSTAQIMELYELMKREQARDHLLTGGIVQPEISSAKVERGTDALLLSETDLANITGTLTQEQTRLADDLQALTRGLLADYGNEASMAAYGYKKFTGTDYWPITTAKEGIHSTVENGGSNTRSIKNIGFAKATLPHANNALDLPGLFRTFTNHASDMIDYAAWLCPMEDLNRLYNFEFRDSMGNRTGQTIKGLLERVGGKGAQRYWSNLMEDIQNGIRAKNDSPVTAWFSKGIGSFKGAAVGGNLRVVIQQPTAFFRALAVLSPADLSRGAAKGATRGNGWKKALQHSPIAKRKNLGGFDINSPAQLGEQMFDGRSGVQKLNDAMSWAAGKADAVTWGRLWNACEWATAREHKGLQKGGEEFYRAVNELFTDVIAQTQVVDGVLQRSQIMRSSSALAQQATSFMGEPIMSLNLFLRSWDKVRYEQDAKKRGKAIRNLGRAGTALVLTNVVNALAQSLNDAMRDDDEDKKYWERFRTAFTGVTGEEETFADYLSAILLEGNAGSGMNPVGQIPFVKDVLSMAQGYSVARTDMEVLNDIVSASKLFLKSADGGGQKTRAYAVKSLLASAAKLWGIPASNVARDIWAAVRTAAAETGCIPLQYEMEKAIYSLTNESNKSRYCDILYRALEQGDMDSYERIHEDLMNSMGLSGTSIDSAMRSRYDKAVENDASYTLNQEARDLIGSRDQYAGEQEKTESFGADDLDAEAYKSYNEQRAADQRSWTDKLEGYRGFKNLDDAARDYALDAAGTLAEDIALRDHSEGQFTDEDLSQWERWATQGGDYGVDETEAILFKTAYEMAQSDKDENGKAISGSKKENTLEAAAELMPWLTDRELEYLMSNFWTTGSSGFGSGSSTGGSGFGSASGFGSGFKAGGFGG